MNKGGIDLKVVTIVVLAVVVVVFGWLLVRKSAAPAEVGGGGQWALSGATSTSQKAADCTVKETTEKVMGDSMKGILGSGQQVKVLQNYYACHSPETGDVVVFTYAGSPDPLVKIVKGKPGDSFVLQKSGSGWNMVVNGQVVKNSAGVPYVVGQAGYGVLSLYVHDYKGFIPDAAYLILGNDPAGSLDSTRFGLVGIDGFVGKVAM